MQSDNEKLEHSNANAAEIRHPLTEKDGELVAVMRTEAASSKGKLSGADARGSFDELMIKQLLLAGLYQFYMKMRQTI
ncbi:hypothetical protein [Nostoc sp.]|uniref:hypothetical protein n=1 Tax=Nostoc sp. TaxID=1180 RepID=UPI002FFA2FC6